MKTIRQYLKTQTDYRHEGSIAYKTRHKRMNFFNKYFENYILENCFGKNGKLTILDVGGVPEYWQYLGFKYIDRVSITSLNIVIENVPNSLRNVITPVKGTATDMHEFDDKSFDLVFSNSVIEHVGSFKEQEMMAREMHRVARHGFLQTPNKYFFMEPHFLFPYFQLLPTYVKRKMVLRFNLGHFPKANTIEEANSIVESVHLLSNRQLKKLFPHAQERKEKWIGLTKSYILYW